MKRLAFILTSVLGILLPLYYYLATRLESDFAWILIAILFSLVLSFPLMRKIPFVVHLTFIAMGFLSFLLVFIIIKDVLLLAGFPFHPHWAYITSTCAFMAGTVVALRGPKIVYLRLPIENLPQALNGLRIVQISDLHVGPTIRKKYVEKIVKKVNALEPDIIALTGDIGDGPVEKYRDDVAPLAQLKSKLGVFYVPGNHEFYWNGNEWMAVFNNLKAIILLNRGKKISHLGENIFIGGVSDPAGPIKPDPESIIQTAKGTSLKILLSHRPGIAIEAAELGYDLQLSGHTHGGQFFPWTIAVRLFHRHFVGLHKVKSMWLNVNTGTGNWGPFLRLGTNSEITIIEVFTAGKSLE